MSSEIIADSNLLAQALASAAKNEGLPNAIFDALRQYFAPRRDQKASARKFIVPLKATASHQAPWAGSNSSLMIS